MPDRKPLLSRLVVRVAIVAALIYAGVVGAERYYRYCDYRLSMSPSAALRQTLTFTEPPPAESFESEATFSEIEPGFFVGGSVKTPPPGVQAVLNLCEIEDRYKAETRAWMMIHDAEPAPELDWLRKAVDFVAEQRQRGKTVYVHCAAGISRAGMVSSAYLMQDRGWSRDEALAYIREQRPQVNPNPAFMDLLEEWEKELTDGK